MKAVVAAALLCGALNVPTFASSPSAFERIAEPMAPRNIQVLLEKDASEVLLEVKGPYYIFNPHDGTRIASGLLAKRFMVRELDTGIKWGEEFAGIHQIYIQPRSPETAIFVNGIQYSGAVAVYGVAGQVNVINDIDMESYVKSLLTAQFAKPMETEVLSALAILARTDAYYHATKAPTSFWHVNAKEVGYQGSALVVAGSNIDHAVETTRHLILVHPENGKNLPFATAWTENSAGKTAPYHSIFRKDAFAPEKGVEAPLAALSRTEHKWSYHTSKKELARTLGMSQIQAMELFVDQSSNKVYAVRAKNGQQTQDIDFLALQELVGKDHLQSSDFTVLFKDDGVTFNGFGKGHGVGLCLYSASALANNGASAVKILSKFFPETYLYNLNALPSN